MKIEYKTTLTDRKDTELRNLANEQNNEEALRELLIRSVNNYFPELKRDAAIAACNKALKTQPRHNLFNLVRACHESDTRKKMKFYEAAAKSDDPCGNEVTAQAALELARLYLAQYKYIEAQAWLVRAILTGSTKAESEFLGHRYDDHYCLGGLSALQYNLPEQLCRTAHTDAELQKLNISAKKNASIIALANLTFLAVILGNRKFNRLPDSGWICAWKPELKETLIAANYDYEKALTYLQSNDTPINQIAKSSIWFDPYLYLDLFTYCIMNKIITDEAYLNVMQFFLHNTPDPAHDPSLKKKLTDQAFYYLYLFHLYRKDQPRYNACLDQISPQFNEFRVIDVAALPAREQDKVTYELFKRLTQRKQYKEALLFLNNVKDPHTLDHAIFDFFKDADPDGNNYEIYKFKKWLFKKIIETPDPDFQRSFFDRVLNESIALNDKSTEFCLEFLSIIGLIEDYMEIREQRKKENPKRTWRYDDERKTFLAEAKNLASTHPVIQSKDKNLTRQECETVLNDFVAFHNRWLQKISGPNIKVVFDTVGQRLNEIHQRMLSMRIEEFRQAEKPAEAAPPVTAPAATVQISASQQYPQYGLVSQYYLMSAYNPEMLYSSAAIPATFQPATVPVFHLPSYASADPVLQQMTTAATIPAIQQIAYSTPVPAIQSAASTILAPAVQQISHTVPAAVVAANEAAEQPVYGPQPLYPVTNGSNNVPQEEPQALLPEPDPLKELSAMFRQQNQSLYPAAGTTENPVASGEAVNTINDLLEQLAMVRNNAAPVLPAQDQAPPAQNHTSPAADSQPDAPLRSPATAAPKSALFQPRVSPYTQLENLPLPPQDAPASRQSDIDQLAALPPVPQTEIKNPNPTKTAVAGF